MAKKEITVTFKTITPLWTGDAWGESKEIRPSSLIGSMRFWFEVICYFSKITKDKNYVDGKLNDNVDAKLFKEKILESAPDFNGIDNTLAGLGISLPSRVFGCTGWKGWIKIKQIDFNKNSFQDQLKGRIIKNKNWFWGTPYYDGKFSILFEVEENIIDSIFCPLLTFIEKYGFLGGKWNIGYGRIKIENIEGIKCSEWRKKEFKLENNIIKFTDFIELNNSLNLNSKAFEFVKYFLGINSFYCNDEREFAKKISSIPKRIKIAKFDISNTSYVNLIKELLKKKSEIRDCLRHIYENKCFDNKGNFLKNVEFEKGKKCFSIANELFMWRNFRHKLLGLSGTTSEKGEGSKILPFIYEENNQLKGGFLSIAGLLNLEGESDG